VRGEDVVELLTALARAGIEAWVEGGWGVDALVGRELRSHKDVDLIVRRSDAGAVVELIQALGFRLATGTPPSALYRDGSGRAVDIRAVDFDADGRGIYRATEGDEWICPAEGFDGRGTIGGTTVRCLTPEVQMLSHVGYDAKDKDVHDVQVLHENFGVPLPGEYAPPTRPTP
jgi:lincosamide nucleotidyltransferase A/C/D/E